MSPRQTTSIGGRVHTLARRPHVGDIIVTAGQEILWTVEELRMDVWDRRVELVCCVDTATGRYPNVFKPHEVHVVSRGDVTRLTRHGIPTRWQVSP